jgi:hypothetical protein
MGGRASKEVASAAARGAVVASARPARPPVAAAAARDQVPQEELIARVNVMPAIVSREADGVLPTDPLPDLAGGSVHARPLPKNRSKVVKLSPMDGTVKAEAGKLTEKQVNSLLLTKV